MLGALLLVIAAVGSLSLRRLQASLDNSYRAQREYSTRQLEQRTNNYFQLVEEQSAINAELFADGAYSTSDLGKIVPYWLGVMRRQLQLSSLSVNLDADGQMLEVARLSN